MEANAPIISRSPEATRRLASRLVTHLLPGAIVALIGELGTGKTRFVEGAARELGYAGRVRSPSYTLLNIYRARLPIYHFDLYRWEAAGADEELEEWEEIMDGDGVSFIEWAERLADRLPPRAVSVYLEHAGETERRIRVAWPGERADVVRRLLMEDVP